ncbi:MAG TPA: FAD-dependent oxidoreductase [Trebonia sp.]|nr:FAD-dependent oxidoreductase [Trebonia sp.]
MDLTRCEGYGQCAFLAPDVFRMRSDEALMYETEPDDAQREAISRAEAACPVQAITAGGFASARAQPRPPAAAASAAAVSAVAAAVSAAAAEAGAVPAQRSPRSGTAAMVEAFRRSGRIVIVGASLAGLRAATGLRDEGFTGSLTLIGDEAYKPYDRPPLSKQVLAGFIAAERTALPRSDELNARWMLGSAATGLDLVGKQVRLADGGMVEYDRLLIATGTRARPWPNQAEAALDGVFVLRTRDDAASLRQRLAARPGRVLVIGAGFTGSEVASACRDQDVPVTVVERGPAPLVGALGEAISAVAGDIQREHGVDLRCGVTVTRLAGDGNGRLRRANLSDDATIDTDTAVVALGALRNVEWLQGSGLAVGPWGVACDAGCRVFDANGVVTDDVFVAGDVARSPHPVYEYQFLAVEHWGNAVTQATVAAHNMINAAADRWPHVPSPVFWSVQFGTNIKSVGVPSYADQVVIAQGSVAERRFVAVYGYRGRVTAAVGFDQGMWLESYQKMIDAAAPFPPSFLDVSEQDDRQPVPVGLPDPRTSTGYDTTVMVTGHDPSERRAELVYHHR